ncbi:MAG TPA: DUF4837 family protein [Candidatus Cloacimonadota bacterium]|nr:DUF4837 family protein [Candidatus Cloacimonadota bacterium]
MKKTGWLLMCVLLLAACGKNNDNSQKSRLDSHKPMSWGHKQDVYVFADDNVWKYAEHYIRATLERTEFTTMNEAYFEVKRAPLQEMESFYKFNNLLFLSDMENDSPVNNYVKKIMGEAISEDIKKNSIGVYPQNNLWANDQFVLFLVGDTERHLLELNIEMQERTFQLFRQRLYDRISEQVFKSRTYDPSFFSTFGWELNLPKSYVVYKHNPADNFVSFIARLRDKPDRYLSVYTEPMESDRVDDKWLKEKRAELAWKYYDEDEFLDRDIRWQRYELGSFSGWKLAGRWQNKKYAVGGAFQSFAFYDADTQTAYLIDNSVYFPDGYKLAALIETEVISRTLKIKK